MSDTQKIIVAKVGELKDGEMKTVTFMGKKVTVANVDGDYFGFDDTCTHQQCSLANGFLDGSAIICSCHGAQFDVTTGDVLSLPATRNLNTYLITVIGSDIILQNK